MWIIWWLLSLILMKLKTFFFLSFERQHSFFIFHKSVLVGVQIKKLASKVKKKSEALEKKMNERERINLLPAVCPLGLQLPECPWGQRWVYLWAAVLASTTLAECIQERTASGSSFILAVAPRGRLSWIPNILGAPEVPPAPLHHQEDKTAGGGTNRRKSPQGEERALLDDGGLADLVCLWRHQNLRNQPHTQRRKGRENKRRRTRRGWRYLRAKKSRKKCAEGSDPSVLLSCTTFNLFLFNST